MQYLPLQVSEVDDVEINDSQGPHTGSREIKRQRGAESACSDAKHLCIQELELSFHAHFWKDKVTFVAVDLVVGQGGYLGHKGPRFKSAGE